MLDTSSKASKYQVEDFAGKIESFCCCCFSFFVFFFHEGAGVGPRALTSWTEIYFMVWFSSFQNCLPKHHEIVISSYHKPQLNPQHSKVNSLKFSQYTANPRWFCKMMYQLALLVLGPHHKWRWQVAHLATVTWITWPQTGQWIHLTDRECSSQHALEQSPWWCRNGRYCTLVVINYFVRSDTHVDVTYWY